MILLMGSEINKCGIIPVYQHRFTQGRILRTVLKGKAIALSMAVIVVVVVSLVLFAPRQAVETTVTHSATDFFEDYRSQLQVVSTEQSRLLSAREIIDGLSPQEAVMALAERQGVRVHVLSENLNTLTVAVDATPQATLVDWLALTAETCHLAINDLQISAEQEGKRAIAQLTWLKR